MDETANNQNHSGERSHEEIMVIIVALMLAMLLAALDQTIVATALPRIATDLHGLNKLAWVATAYLLTSAISTPLYGKISDQFGRKKIFQFAIVVFLIGSALCGQARDMDQLVAFRALQGLGAGGLMSLSMTIVGDVVSPRQRGKYLAYFGAVFAVSSVAGPLLGGFFTDSLSWRWVFYVNLPLGAIALSVIAARLHLPVRKSDKRIDYVGAVLLACSVIPIILATVWGGVTYPWGSTTIISLFAGGVLAAIVFGLWEHRAPEAIIPTNLFKNDIFRVSVILSLLAGVALFAAILFIPEYQQIVRGDSAVKSGLLLLPLVAGMLTTLIVSGRLITKWGHYRIFPIIGTLVTAFGVWLFSHLTLHTSQLTLSIWMVVVGAGVGMFLQVMTLAVQNSVPSDELGIATASATFFRTLGSSLGGAVFGAILTNRLTYHLKQLIPHAGSLGASASSLSTSVETGATPTFINKLPPSISHDIYQAFVLSFHDMFLFAVPVLLIAFVAALFLREVPLRNTTRGAEIT
ncbi:MAG TPA: MDR family MFS transporter [Candidatus Saccharimonadales bacterium]|nr:MDR family MFS transporter [Candidatus Saccharimonadales bacterium]